MQHFNKMVEKLAHFILAKKTEWQGLFKPKPRCLSRNVRLYQNNLTKKMRNRLLVEGTIFPHEKIKPFLAKQGDIHVIVVDPRLKRPFIFALYENVSLPFSYKITGNNIVIPERYDDVFSTRFYLEVAYTLPASGFRKRGAIGGEAWGKDGKLSLFEPGIKTDICLSFLWTKKLLRGDMIHPPGRISSMWVDIQEDMKPLLREPNELVIECKTTLSNNLDNPIVVARKTLKNIKLTDLPFDVHIMRDDFLRKDSWYLMNKTVFFEAYLTSFGHPFKEKLCLEGYRASKYVQINGRTKNIRMILHRVRFGKILRDKDYCVKNGLIGKKYFSVQEQNNNELILNSSGDDKPFLFGTVAVHEKLFKSVCHANQLLIRVWNYQEKRIIGEKVYQSPILWPFNYVVKYGDIRGTLSTHAQFFVEALVLINDKSGAYCMLGEGWGKAGRLYLLKPGSQSDIIIAGFTSIHAQS